jgi:hypothetical protein
MSSDEKAEIFTRDHASLTGVVWKPEALVRFGKYYSRRHYREHDVIVSKIAERERFEFVERNATA